MARYKKELVRRQRQQQDAQALEALRQVFNAPENRGLETVIQQDEQNEKPLVSQETFESPVIHPTSIFKEPFPSPVPGAGVSPTITQSVVQTQAEQSRIPFDRSTTVERMRHLQSSADKMPWQTAPARSSAPTSRPATTAAPTRTLTPTSRATATAAPTTARASLTHNWGSSGQMEARTPTATRMRPTYIKTPKPTDLPHVPPTPSAPPSATPAPEITAPPAPSLVPEPEPERETYDVAKTKERMKALEQENAGWDWQTAPERKLPEVSQDEETPPPYHEMTLEEAQALLEEDALPKNTPAPSYEGVATGRPSDLRGAMPTMEPPSTEVPPRYYIGERPTQNPFQTNTPSSTPAPVATAAINRTHRFLPRYKQPRVPPNFINQPVTPLNATEGNYTEGNQTIPFGAPGAIGNIPPAPQEDEQQAATPTPTPYPIPFIGPIQRPAAQPQLPPAAGGNQGPGPGHGPDFGGGGPPFGGGGDDHPGGGGGNIPDRPEDMQPPAQPGAPVPGNAAAPTPPPNMPRGQSNWMDGLTVAGALSQMGQSGLNTLSRYPNLPWWLLGGAGIAMGANMARKAWGYLHPPAPLPTQVNEGQADELMRSYHEANPEHGADMPGADRNTDDYRMYHNRLMQQYVNRPAIVDGWRNYLQAMQAQIAAGNMPMNLRAANQAQAMVDIIHQIDNGRLRPPAQPQGAAQPGGRPGPTAPSAQPPTSPAPSGAGPGDWLSLGRPPRKPGEAQVPMVIDVRLGHPEFARQVEMFRTQLRGNPGRLRDLMEFVDQALRAIYGGELTTPVTEAQLIQLQAVMEAIHVNDRNMRFPEPGDYLPREIPGGDTDRRQYYAIRLNARAQYAEDPQAYIQRWTDRILERLQARRNGEELHPAELAELQALRDQIHEHATGTEVPIGLAPGADDGDEEESGAADDVIAPIDVPGADRREPAYARVLDELRRQYAVLKQGDRDQLIRVTGLNLQEQIDAVDDPDDIADAERRAMLQAYADFRVNPIAPEAPVTGSPAAPPRGRHVRHWDAPPPEQRIGAMGRMSPEVLRAAQWFAEEFALARGYKHITWDDLVEAIENGIRAIPVDDEGNPTMNLPGETTTREGIAHLRNVVEILARHFGYRGEIMTITAADNPLLVPRPGFLDGAVAGLRNLLGRARRAFRGPAAVLAAQIAGADRTGEDYRQRIANFRMRFNDGTYHLDDPNDQLTMQGIIHRARNPNQAQAVLDFYAEHGIRLDPPEGSTPDPGIDLSGPDAGGDPDTGLDVSVLQPPGSSDDEEIVQGNADGPLDDSDELDFNLGEQTFHQLFDNFTAEGIGAVRQGQVVALQRGRRNEVAYLRAREEYDFIFQELFQGRTPETNAWMIDQAVDHVTQGIERFVGQARALGPHAAPADIARIQAYFQALIDALRPYLMNDGDEEMDMSSDDGGEVLDAALASGSGGGPIAGSPEEEEEEAGGEAEDDDEARTRQYQEGLDNAYLLVEQELEVGRADIDLAAVGALEEGIRRMWENFNDAPEDFDANYRQRLTNLELAIYIIRRDLENPGGRSGDARAAGGDAGGGPGPDGGDDGGPDGGAGGGLDASLDASAGAGAGGGGPAPDGGGGDDGGGGPGPDGGGDGDDGPPADPRIDIRTHMGLAPDQEPTYEDFNRFYRIMRGPLMAGDENNAIRDAAYAWQRELGAVSPTEARVTRARPRRRTGTVPEIAERPNYRDPNQNPPFTGFQGRKVYGDNNLELQPGLDGEPRSPLNLRPRHQAVHKPAEFGPADTDRDAQRYRQRYFDIEHNPDLTPEQRLEEFLQLHEAMRRHQVGLGGDTMWDWAMNGRVQGLKGIHSRIAQLREEINGPQRRVRGTGLQRFRDPARGIANYAGDRYTVNDRLNTLMGFWDELMQQQGEYMHADGTIDDEFNREIRLLENHILNLTPNRAVPPMIRDRRHLIELLDERADVAGMDPDVWIYPGGGRIDRLDHEIEDLRARMGIIPRPPARSVAATRAAIADAKKKGRP